MRLRRKSLTAQSPTGPGDPDEDQDDDDALEGPEEVGDVEDDDGGFYRRAPSTTNKDIF